MSPLGHPYGSWSGGPSRFRRSLRALPIALAAAAIGAAAGGAAVLALTGLPEHAIRQAAGYGGKEQAAPGAGDHPAGPGARAIAQPAVPQSQQAVPQSAQSAANPGSAAAGGDPAPASSDARSAANAPAAAGSTAPPTDPAKASSRAVSDGKSAGNAAPIYDHVDNARLDELRSDQAKAHSHHKRRGRKSAGAPARAYDGGRVDGEDGGWRDTDDFSNQAYSRGEAGERWRYRGRDREVNDDRGRWGWRDNWGD